MTKKMSYKKLRNKKAFPAIPPDDYEGSIADWIVALHERGYENAEEYYDIYLTEEDYNSLLDECESKAK